MVVPWYINDVKAVLIDKNTVHFKFSKYGTWKITQQRNRLQFERLDEDNTQENNSQQLYIDIIRHEVYEPRLHFYIYRLFIDINKYISVLIIYDGSSASANILAISWSLKKIMRTYREYVKGLKMRYNWL